MTLSCLNTSLLARRCGHWLWPAVEIIRSNVTIPPGVAPEILIHPLSQTVPEGSTVTLVGNAQGSAPITFQWSKDGTPIPGATGPTLTLADATYEQSGSYTFTAMNASGAATSNPAFVCVCLRPIPGIYTRRRPTAPAQDEQSIRITR